MALKGSATIELVNADGSKEVIKHDNMITNAVNDLCMSQRGEMATVLKIVSNGDSYAQALFGGLLLFSTPLNDDPNDYFLPNANITGYASQDAYAGPDIARGSFNASEGGAQEDGSYKFVWDFATSQANGEIKSLALCPNMMGQIGASNSIVDSEGKSFYVKNDLTPPFHSYGRMLPDDATVADISSYYFNIVAIDDDIVYAIDEQNIKLDSKATSKYILNNGGVLKLHKFKLGANDIALADKVAMARYLGCVDVTLPTEFTSILTTASAEFAIAYSFDFKSGTLTLFPCRKKSDILVNGTTKYMDIEIRNNMKMTVYTFTNTTAGKILPRSFTHNSGFKYTLWVGKEYIVVVSVLSSNSKMYVIKRSDNTKVTEVKYDDGSEFVINRTTEWYFKPAFMSSNILVFQTLDTTPGRFYILDMATGILKKTNATDMSIDNNMDIGNKSVFARTFSYLQYRLTVNPFILTTKNNLDSPVTKTASQTMKITYTLSESEAY